MKRVQFWLCHRYSLRQRMNVKMLLDRPNICKRMSRKGGGWIRVWLEFFYKWYNPKNLSLRLHKRDTSWIFQGQGRKMNNFVIWTSFSLPKKVGHTVRSRSWDQKKRYESPFTNLSQKYVIQGQHYEVRYLYQMMGCHIHALSLPSKTLFQCYWDSHLIWTIVFFKKYIFDFYNED